MQKLLCFNNQNHQSFSGKRLVMQFAKGPETPSAQPQAPVQRPSIAETVEHNYNEHLNTEPVKFSTDFNTTFSELAKEARKSNPDITPNTLRANYEAILQPPHTLTELFAYLEKQQCQSVAVKNGEVQFLAGNGPIDHSQFLRPIEMKIGGTLDLTPREKTTESSLQLRQSILNNFAKQISSFKTAEHLPDIPPSKLT